MEGVLDELNEGDTVQLVVRTDVVVQIVCLSAIEVKNAAYSLQITDDVLCRNQLVSVLKLWELSYSIIDNASGISYQLRSNSYIGRFLPQILYLRISNMPTQSQR